MAMCFSPSCTAKRGAALGAAEGVAVARGLSTTGWGNASVNPIDITQTSARGFLQTPCKEPYARERGWMNDSRS